MALEVNILNPGFYLQRKVMGCQSISYYQLQEVDVSSTNQVRMIYKCVYSLVE